nr:MAG TPA: hypothetical protein [Caudoviricetes sp.]
MFHYRSDNDMYYAIALSSDEINELLCKNDGVNAE